MFDNIKQILPIIYLKTRKTNEFLEELLAEDVIPIGIVIKDVKSYHKGEEIHEDLLPCFVYKENYRS
jgi:hypothetical protein